MHECEFPDSKYIQYGICLAPSHEFDAANKMMVRPKNKYHALCDNMHEHGPVTAQAMRHDGKDDAALSAQLG